MNPGITLRCRGSNGISYRPASLAGSADDSWAEMKAPRQRRQQQHLLQDSEISWTHWIWMMTSAVCSRYTRFRDSTPKGASGLQKTELFPRKIDAPSNLKDLAWDSARRKGK